MSSPRLRETAAGARWAIAFLTILPVRLREGDGDHGATAAPAWFALVGAGVGLLAGGVYAATAGTLGASVAAALAVATLVVVTGALHQDGLADCADGLGVRGDRARRLAVMRDPANGTFGTLALVLWGLILVTALAQLTRGEAVGALAAAGAIGRWAALLHARWTPPARADGLGSAFVPSPAGVVLAGLSAVAVAVASDLRTAGPALVAGLVAAAASVAMARRAFGGRTGDTLGATVVLAELAVVLIAVAASRGR